MAFVPKVWKDAPDHSTPLSAAALEDLETRVTGYADSVSGGSDLPTPTVAGDLLRWDGAAWGLLNPWFLVLRKPWFLAADATYLYCATRGGNIRRRPLNGGLPVEQFNYVGPDGSALEGIAVNATHIFWIDNDNGKIQRVALAAQNASDQYPYQDLVTGLPNPGGLAVDATHIYYGDTGAHSIGRANLDGTGANNSWLVGGGTALEGIAVNATHIFWADPAGHAIGRANLDGTGINNAFVTVPSIGGIANPWDIEITATHIYWSSQWDYIGRANLDGTNPEVWVRNTQTGGPIEGLAVAGDYLYYTENGWEADVAGAAGFVGRVSL
jgi:hypothetical protein